jgi:serine/threonine protein kinase
MRSIANGKYVLREALGHGGTAQVFRAQRSTDSQVVAAKIIPIRGIASASELLGRYEELARLEHPHILPILEVGISEEVLYVVSPLADEGSLRQALQRGQVLREGAVELIVHIGDALDYAHARGILHLDVKPANILLASGSHALLGDFSVMQANPGATGHPRVRGTPAYMAPEQCTLRPTGPAADQYALGVTSFELLTGRRPFAADSPTELLRRQVLEPPPAPSIVCPDLPPGLDYILGRALSKEPRQRFPTVKSFAVALAEVMGSESYAAQPPRASSDEERTLEVVTLDLRPGASGQRL